jgi:hypothetical protein
VSDVRGCTSQLRAARRAAFGGFAVCLNHTLGREVGILYICFYFMVVRPGGEIRRWFGF